MTNITFSEPQNTPHCQALFEVTAPLPAGVGRLTGAPGWIASPRALLRTTEPAVDVVAALPGLSFFTWPLAANGNRDASLVANRRLGIDRKALAAYFFDTGSISSSGKSIGVTRPYT